jgi:hypothetical protein
MASRTCRWRQKSSRSSNNSMQGQRSLSTTKAPRVARFSPRISYRTMADKRLVFFRGLSSCVCCKATSEHDRLCRRKGKLCDPNFGSCNQRLACCTCLPHSRRPATALTDGQPQSSGEPGGAHGIRTLGFFARTRATCAAPCAPAGVAWLSPILPARAATQACGQATRRCQAAGAPARACSVRRDGCGRSLIPGALLHPGRHAAPSYKSATSLRLASVSPSM